MAMPDSDSDNALTRSTHDINTLFVDTNLDTHLAMIVSGTDTVSDLKKKILSEHPHCFPDFGEVKIHALKVKRKGYYYHLSDSMLVKSAFEGVKKGWFLSVDASSLKQSNSAKSQPDLLCTIKTPSDERNHHLDASPSRNLSLLDTSLPQPGSIQYINQQVPSTKTNVRTGSEELPERCVETRDMTIDDNVHCNGLFIEASTSNPAAEKKRKRKENKTSLSGFSKEIPNQMARTSEKTTEDEQKNTVVEDKHKTTATNSDNLFTEFPDNSARDISVTAPYSSFSDRLNEETKKEESMLSQAKRKKISKQKTVDASSKGANEENVVMSINEAEPLPFTQENRTTEKRKKKSVAAKQVMSSTEHADNSARDISLIASSSSFDHHSNKETKKEESMLAQAERNKISKRKSVDTSYKGANGENVVISGNEADFLLFSPESWTKEKRKKKSVAAKQVMSSTEHADNSARDISSPRPYSSFKDHPNEETKKEESMLAQAERNKISKQKTVDASYKGANGDNVVRSVNEADYLPFSPESRTTEKRKKKSVAAKQVRSSTEHADNSARDISSAAHYSSFKDHPNEETKKEESMLAQAERNKISKQKTVDTSYKGANGDNVFRSVNKADSLPFSPESRTTEKRKKKSVAVKQVRSSTEHADNSARDISFAAHYSSFKDHLNEETKKEESMLAQAERNEISKQKTLDISYKGANGENVVKSGNEAGSLPVTPESGTTDNIEFRDENSWKKGKRRVISAAETLADLSVEHQEPFQLNQINMTQKNAENMDEKSGKRTKNSQNFAAKCLPDLTTEEQERGAEELTCSRDTHREVGTSSKVRKKTKSVKTSSKYQLSGQELELGKNSGSEYGSVLPAQTLRAGELVEVPSADTRKGNFSGMPLRHDANGNALGNHSMNDANDQLEVSKSGANQVDFKDYFVRGENKQEIAPVEKASKAERSVAEVKAKKLVEPSSASSPDIQDPLKPNENPGNKKKSLGRNYSSIQHEDSLVKDEHNMVELHSKSLDVPKNEIKARESHDIKHIKNTTQETKLSNVANGLKMSSYVPAYQKENSQSSDAAYSSSESSRKYLQNKKKTKHQSSLDSHVIVAKTSSRNRGEVVNSSRQERSLLATPGTIFRDGSSDSSEDENGAVNSDASTKTPSDNSSSSGYSEGETKAIQNSPRNGGGAKRKGGMMNSQASGGQNITMDMILRSSNRFKKAKLTAAHHHHHHHRSQLEDTESQPVDFVPDSQANP